MINKKLIARKIERARRVVAMSKDIDPPRWAVLWAQRKVAQ